jgi:hypothetical protein
MSGMSPSSDLLKGMRDRNPSATDKSTRLPGMNIDSDATRSSTAPTPKTLGPREA